MWAKLTFTLSFIEEQLGGFLLVVSVFLIVLQVLLRAVLGFGMSGIYELATFCVIWSVILTAGLGIRTNVHVRVDVVMRIVPPRVAFVLEILVCLTMGLIGAALVYSGWLLVEESLIFQDSTLGTIRIPMWVPQAIMPVGGLLIVVHTLGRVIALHRGDIPVLRSDELVAST